MIAAVQDVPPQDHLKVPRGTQPLLPERSTRHPAKFQLLRIQPSRSRASLCANTLAGKALTMPEDSKPYAIEGGGTWARLAAAACEEQLGPALS